MSEDTRDFIEQTLSFARHMRGKEATPDDVVLEFAKRDLTGRAEVLNRLEAEGGGELSVRQAAKEIGYHRALKSTHEMLRKVGR